MTQNNEALDQR